MKIIKEIKVMLSTCGLCQGVTSPHPRKFLQRFLVRKIPKTSKTQVELLSIQAPNRTCVPGQNGCEVSATTKTTTTRESMTMATTTTKTTPILRNIVTQSKPTICQSGRTDCKNYRKCSIDKRSGKIHCKVSYERGRSLGWLVIVLNHLEISYDCIILVETTVSQVWYILPSNLL